MPKVFRGGQLVEVSEEELRKQTAEHGLAAPPITPLGAQSIGASPDATKMAGTAQQKAPALKQAVEGKESLRDVMRREQPREEATAQEQQKQERAQKLEQRFGSLGTQVAAQINKYLTPPPPAEGKPTEGLVAEDIAASEAMAAQGVAEEDRATVADALIKVAKGDSTAWATLNEKLGGISPEQIAALMPSEELTQAALANRTPDMIPISEMQDQLGVAPEELQAMGLTEASSLQELQAGVQAQLDQEFSAVEDMRTRAMDPNLGPNERQAALRELKDAGAVGVFATEDEMDALGQEIDSADEIKFGDETLTVSELLDDERMSGIVSTMLADPDYAAKIAETHPELAAWVEQHNNALMEVAGDVESAAEDVAATQIEREEIETQFNGLLGEDLAKELFGEGYGTFGTEGYSTEEFQEFADFLTDENNAQAAPLGAWLKENPEMLGELKELGTEELQTITEPGNWENFQRYHGVKTGLDQIDQSNPDAVLDLVFGEDISLNELEQMLETDSITASALSALIDWDGDNKVDANVGERLADILPDTAVKGAEFDLFETLDTQLGEARNALADWKKAREAEKAVQRDEDAAEAERRGKEQAAKIAKGLRPPSKPKKPDLSGAEKGLMKVSSQAPKVTPKGTGAKLPTTKFIEKKLGIL